jgi:hypothetical protein
VAPLKENVPVAPVRRDAGQLAVGVAGGEFGVTVKVYGTVIAGTLSLYGVLATSPTWRPARLTGLKPGALDTLERTW